MKKKIIKTFKYILVILMLIVSIFPAKEFDLYVQRVEATSISEVQNQIDQTKQDLENINDSISGLSDEQDLLLEKMDDLTAEIMNVMTTIGMLEDEIASKQESIILTQEQYEIAKQQEEEQYEAMKVRVQLMYEEGNASIMESFFDFSSFSDMLNRADYAQQVYNYDKAMLIDYETSKQLVHDLWDSLEAEKVELEADKVDMEEQKAYNDGLLAKLKQESDNYDVLIAQAKQEAAAAKKLLQQEQNQLKKLQEEERKKQIAQNAGNGNYSVTQFDTKVIDNASGSDLGKKIAKYGCQYIGNPYVAGGTSLTNGADCSGFTYRIYQNFGYDIPRTSYSQRSAGTAVDYANAQPGDLICYEGHVGLYVGGGYIVHASSARTGIKISKATYRTILSVRRII